jgi:hypothetical protein
MKKLLIGLMALGSLSTFANSNEQSNLSRYNITKKLAKILQVGINSSKCKVSGVYFVENEFHKNAYFKVDIEELQQNNINYRHHIDFSVYETKENTNSRYMTQPRGNIDIEREGDVVSLLFTKYRKAVMCDSLGETRIYDSNGNRIYGKTYCNDFESLSVSYNEKTSKVTSLEVYYREHNLKTNEEKVFFDVSCI